MPIYEYECVSKGHRFEVFQKIADRPVGECRVCGGKVRKLISPSAFQMKGGGWYRDGYTKSPPKKPETPKSESAGAESKSVT